MSSRITPDHNSIWVLSSSMINFFRFEYIAIAKSGPILAINYVPLPQLSDGNSSCDKTIFFVDGAFASKFLLGTSCSWLLP